MKNISVALLAFVATLLSSQLNAKEALCQEGDAACSFVLLQQSTGKLSVINEARAKTPMSPFSTFKIANSIIGLETGLIKDAQQVLSYDKKKYPTQKWWPSVWKLPSYNLSSAYKFSVVPIYRQLATDIGEQRMSNYLQQFDYGNKDISSGLDNFWLNKSIKISALEQVQFLQKVQQNQFKLSASTLSTMKTVMLANDQPKYKIYAKTGAGKVDDGSMLGWYVGIVETAQDSFYFALNFNRDSYKQMKKDRVEMALNHLKQAGVID